MSDDEEGDTDGVSWGVVAEDCWGWVAEDWRGEGCVVTCRAVVDVAEESCSCDMTVVSWGWGEITIDADDDCNAAAVLAGAAVAVVAAYICRCSNGKSCVL